jgi:hypothetical protein
MDRTIAGPVDLGEAIYHYFNLIGGENTGFVGYASIDRDGSIVTLKIEIGYDIDTNTNTNTNKPPF